MVHPSDQEPLATGPREVTVHSFSTLLHSAADTRQALKPLLTRKKAARSLPAFSSHPF